MARVEYLQCDACPKQKQWVEFGKPGYDADWNQGWITILLHTCEAPRGWEFCSWTCAKRFVVGQGWLEE